jgi:hypothetical protein
LGVVEERVFFLVKEDRRPIVPKDSGMVKKEE